MIKRLWWSWTLGVLLAASAACGGASSELTPAEDADRTDMLCRITRGSCNACDASLQQWCSDDDESMTEPQAALCVSTRGACSLCEAALDAWCGGP